MISHLIERKPGRKFIFVWHLPSGWHDSEMVKAFKSQVAEVYMALGLDRKEFEIIAVPKGCVPASIIEIKEVTDE